MDYTMTPFFIQAAVSPGRQRFFRNLVGVHLLIVATALAIMRATPGSNGLILFGSFLLVTGIVEGALMIGWRLTQIPKSRALEFLLASPLHPTTVFVAEAAVGICRLALVTLSGLPIFVMLVYDGTLIPFDLATLLILPWLWGTITGIGLAAWAYESVLVRWIGERVMVAGLIFYLVVGIMAGEHLRVWLGWLPTDVRNSFLGSFYAFHHYNPFGSMRAAMELPVPIFWSNWATVQLGGVILLIVLFARAAFRMAGHFRDRHYGAILSPTDGLGQIRGHMGEHPLAWWAVKRVSEYAGRINLWLAGGFGLLYAIYTVAGPHWPSWMGRAVFQVFDRLGGIPMLSTALVLLAAVPAAFQYGLWDSNTQDRCRRLELLLLTDLQARDYWRAAAAAAWHRGRGYFVVALILWLAGWIAGQFSWAQVGAGIASGVILWGLYFSLGFRAFSRGMQANSLGIALTLGLPGLAWLLFRAAAPWLTSLTPPGAVYWFSSSQPTLIWIIGPALCTALTLTVARLAIAQCDGELRLWLETYHGRKVVD